MDDPNILPDLVVADDETLAILASRAFRLGLRDARHLKNPRDSFKVMEDIPAHHPHRIYHRLKLRQVYGAGFDIGKGNAKLLAQLPKEAVA